MEIFRFLFLKQGWKIFFALYVKKKPSGQKKTLIYAKVYLNFLFLHIK